MARLALIAAAGAAGSVIRYGVSVWAAGLTAALPLGTFLVNSIGSFLLAVLMRVGLQTPLFSENVRLALSVGLLGGFTTYSSFNYETLEYLRRGHYGIAWLNVGLTVAGCLAAGAAGLAAGDAIAARIS